MCSSSSALSNVMEKSALVTRLFDGVAIVVDKSTASHCTFVSKPDRYTIIKYIDTLFS